MLDFAISSPGPANDALGTCERSSLGSLSTWGADASAVPPYRNSSSSSIVDASAALDMTRLLGRLLARNKRTWSRSRVFRSCQLQRCAAAHGWPSRGRIGHKQLAPTYIPFRFSTSGHVGKLPSPIQGRRRGDRKESLPSVSSSLRFVHRDRLRTMASATFGNRFRAFMNHPAGPKTGT